MGRVARRVEIRDGKNGSITMAGIVNRISAASAEVIVLFPMARIDRAKEAHIKTVMRSATQPRVLSFK